MSFSNIKRGIDKFINKIKKIFGFSKVEGKIIIAIGGRGGGKTETAKQLCRELKGKKFVFEFDRNGDFIELNEKDKDEYRDIPNCTIIEDGEVELEAGLYINEDFSMLTKEGEAKYLELLKHIRHKGINIIIITHSIGQIPNNILHVVNCLLLYKNAGITPQKLATLITPKKAYAIKRALSNLKEYEYYFISLEDEAWVSQPIDNRDVKILKDYLNGKLKELEDIRTDNNNEGDKEDKRRANAKKPEIEDAISKGMSYDLIAKRYDTKKSYIMKIASEMRRRGVKLPDRRGKEWRRRMRR